MTSSTHTIGLFYGSSTCYTEMAGEKIRDKMSPYTVNLHNMADTPVTDIAHYDRLIFGIPTWDYGELQEDWEAVWDDLDALDLNGKIVAIYGLGDQVGYPEWFLDAMGYLHAKLLALGATIVGYWPREGYEFTGSQALTEDGTQFVGLALDDENEFDQTDARISAWCEQVKTAFFS